MIVLPRILGVTGFHMVQPLCDWISMIIVVLSNNLPKVYVKTTSTLRILNNQVASLNPDFQINVIDSTLNDKIVETLEDSSLLGLHKFTNDSVVSVINGFVNRIYSGVVLTANGLEFVVKSI